MKVRPSPAAAKYRRAANAGNLTCHANGHSDNIAFLFRPLADSVLFVAVRCCGLVQRSSGGACECTAFLAPRAVCYELAKGAWAHA